jgi:hypothetical protein
MAPEKLPQQVETAVARCSCCFLQTMRRRDGEETRRSYGTIPRFAKERVGGWWKEACCSSDDSESARLSDPGGVFRGAINPFPRLQAGSDPTASIVAAGIWEGNAPCRRGETSPALGSDRVGSRRRIGDTSTLAAGDSFRSSGVQRRAASSLRPSELAADVFDARRDCCCHQCCLVARRGLHVSV